MAKLHGSYESIIAGRCCEGLTTVTGCPCETLILGRSNNPDDKNVDHDQLWSHLVHARAQRFLMCAMCSNNSIREEEFEKYGLLNIHAYSLQDVRQSRDGRHRLIQLRNPWGGTYRWTGEIVSVVLADRRTFSCSLKEIGPKDLVCGLTILISPKNCSTNEAADPMASSGCPSRPSSNISNASISAE